MSDKQTHFETEIKKLFIKALSNASITEGSDFDSLTFTLNAKIERFDRLLPGVEIICSGSEVVVTIAGEKSAELRMNLLTNILVKEAFAQNYMKERDASGKERPKANRDMLIPLASLKIGNPNSLTQLELKYKPLNWNFDLAKAASYCGLSLHDHKLNLNNEARSVVSELLSTSQGR